jgi:hypothetical protein
MEGKENESGVTQEMINNLKAESLFLRALSHFDLVRLYAQPYTYDPNGPGVPVVLPLTLPYASQEYCKRSIRPNRI